MFTPAARVSAGNTPFQVHSDITTQFSKQTLEIETEISPPKNIQDIQTWIDRELTV